MKKSFHTEPSFISNLFKAQIALQYFLITYLLSLSYFCNVYFLFRQLIIFIFFIMPANNIIIYEQYIEDFTIMFAFNNMPYIKNFFIFTALRRKMIPHIIICLIFRYLDLTPDIFLHCLYFIWMYKVFKLPFCKFKKIIQIFASDKPYHFLICIKNFFIVNICLVNKKCTGKI